ncbi:MAG: DUF3047 domain-containing protein [Alphaproteobacteria bacterium]|nr:DUF3047 domain-containing protein [Alphaproteobacteria bacterium]
MLRRGTERASRKRRAWKTAPASAGLALCAAFAGSTNIGAQSSDMTLADPARMMNSGERVDFTGANRLSLEETPMGLCLRSTPHSSATGLYQSVEVSPDRLSRIEWLWQVDKIHRTADIRELSREDFAAKIAFVFGEPSFFDRDVPTIAYVWSSTPVENGSIIASRRYANLRYVQLHGNVEAGTWQREQRNVADDFTRAFGTPPRTLRYIALFNDNDQTHEPASALFGAIYARR